MGIADLITSFGNLIGKSFTVLVGVALLVFLWGLAKFIMNKSSEGKVEEGRNLMVWGLVALFVMVSVWGLVAFIQSNLLSGANFDL